MDTLQVGLSTAHILTKLSPIDELTIFEESKHGIREVVRHKYPAEITLHDGGSLISVKRERWKIPQRGGGMRSAVRTFSINSRRRLMRKIAELKRDAYPLFITLTYPADYPTNYRIYKEHLRVFGIYLQRAYPRASFVWRLEFQKRGAPHYHLLAYNVPMSGKKLYSFRAWIAQTWYEIVASGDEKHLHAGTSSERMRSWRQVARYVSKSVAKVSPSMDAAVPGGGVACASAELSKDTQATMEFVGRWWGVIGAKFMPFANKVLMAISDKKAVEMIRYMRRYANLKVIRAYKSLSIFCDASVWMKMLPRILYPDEASPMVVATATA